MLLIPAMDLYEGKVVRLVKGNYEKMTVYSDDPLATAEKIEKDGAEWLHVVDLEGAKSGLMPNFSIIKSILDKTSLKIQVGGGIRSMESIEAYLSAGASRVILGTKAVQDRDFLKLVVDKYPGKIAVALDLKDGEIAVKGWVSTLDIDMMDFLWDISSLGVGTVVVTDVSRDGVMTGANISLYQKLVALSGMQIIASGGVSDISDIRSLRDMGLYGAILGRAMYDGAVKLSDALLEVSSNGN